MNSLLPDGLARSVTQRRLARAILIASITGLLATTAHAQLTWDSDPATPGIQNGNGAWAGGAFWFNGTTNVSWSSGAQAIFNGQPVVNAGGIDAGAITFNGSGVLGTLQQGTSVGALRLTGISPSITVTAPDGNAQITLPLSGTSGLRKEGAGTLTLTGANTYSGTTAINAGTLEVGGGVALPDGTPVTVAAGATFRLLNSETTGAVTGTGAVELPGASVLTMQSGEASE